MFCIKGVCETAQPVGLSLGLMLGFDGLLKEGWLKYYREGIGKETKIVSKELDEISKVIKAEDSEIVKSDLSGPIKDFIESYQNFLSVLSADQIVAVFNLIILTSILMTLFSLSVLLVGDYLIDKLKLEIK